MKNQVLLLTAAAAFAATVLQSCNQQSTVEKVENATDSTTKSEVSPEATGQTAGVDLSDEEKGLKIANAAKAELGKNLMGAIQKFGAPGAVDFCNLRAIPLTDSIAKVHNASIKRVSDKPRNPNNQANKAELAYIKTLKQNLAQGEKTAPQMADLDGKAVGYYTIETNAMCLQCHGIKGKDIKPETWEMIHKKYSNDKATGYTENQVRGIWVVTMNKN